MQENLLKPDKQDKKLIDRLKGFFAFGQGKDIEYSDDFAKEKAVIVDYKSRLKGGAPLPADSPTDAKLYYKPEPKPAAAPKPKPAPRAGGGDKSAGKTGKEGRAEKFSVAGLAGKARERAAAWQAPKMVTTNLIQSEVLTYLDWGARIKVITAAAFAPLLITLAVYAVFSYMDIQSRTQADILGAEIDSLNRQVESAEKSAAEADKFKSKLSLLSGLLDRHIYWTRLFSFLETNILTDAVILGGFSGDIKGIYTFSINSPAYRNVPEQVMVLRNDPLVLSAEISEAKQAAESDKAGEGSSRPAVSYSLRLKLDPKIFYADK